jgi:hypothetical protein
MKHKLPILLFLGIISLCSFGSDKGGIVKTGSVKLEGLFFSQSEEKLIGLSVEIVNLQTNQIEEIQIVKNKAKVELRLGYKYMVYVKKKGYSTKKILVDAREAKRGDYKFEFDMELHEIDETYTTNDFRPVCVLKYSRLKQKFVYDADYTSIAKKDLRQEIYSKR